MDFVRDGSQPLGAMVDRIGRGHHGEEDLGGADIARRFLPADVLFAGLQCQPHCRLPVRIDRYAHQSSWKAAFQGIATRHERCVRAAKTQRYPQTLGTAHCDVGTPLSGRLQECQREEIGGHDDQSTGLVHGFRRLLQITDAPVRGRIGEQNGQQIFPFGVKVMLRESRHLDLNAQRIGSSPENIDGLGVTTRVNEHPGSRGRLRRGDGHGFGRGGAFIEQGGIGDVEACQAGHHGLEREQEFQTALGDLCLVWRVGGIPSGIFQNAALNHRGDQAIMVAEAN